MKNNALLAASETKKKKKRKQNATVKDAQKRDRERESPLLQLDIQGPGPAVPQFLTGPCPQDPGIDAMRILKGQPCSSSYTVLVLF